MCYQARISCHTLYSLFEALHKIQSEKMVDCQVLHTTAVNTAALQLTEWAQLVIKGTQCTEPRAD